MSITKQLQKHVAKGTLRQSDWKHSVGSVELGQETGAVSTDFLILLRQEMNVGI